MRIHVMPMSFLSVFRDVHLIREQECSRVCLDNPALQPRSGAQLHRAAAKHVANGTSRSGRRGCLGRRLFIFTLEGTRTTR